MSLKGIKLYLLYLLTLVSTAVHAQPTLSSQSKLPNVIYILADDLGCGDVSVYNKNAAWKTRHLDRLAENGMRFTDAHTSSSVCTPTRYSILTGRYNWRSALKQGVLGGYSKALITPDRLTVAELLRQRHYATAFIGKWHLGWDWQFINGSTADDDLGVTPAVDFSKPIANGPKEHGFTYSYGFSGSLDMPPYVYVENGSPTAIPTDTTVSSGGKGFWRKGITAPDFDHSSTLQHITDKALDYIGKQAGNSYPFFLYFPLPAPHTPILPTAEFLGKSYANRYGDFVLQVDDVVGQIVEALEESNIRENTLIIFTSDNGCSPTANFKELAAVGHHPSYRYRGHKADIFEGGHRVPFIVSWPGNVPEGVVTDEVICTTDFIATAAAVAKAPLPGNAGEDSYNLLPVLLGHSYPQPLREATVHHSINGSFAIRLGDWKLIMCPGSGGWSFPNAAKDVAGLPPIQLYNLKEDPAEGKNLADERPEKADELKSLLIKYIREGRSTLGPLQRNDGPAHWKHLDWML